MNKTNLMDAVPSSIRVSRYLSNRCVNLLKTVDYKTPADINRRADNQNILDQLIAVAALDKV